MRGIPIVESKYQECNKNYSKIQYLNGPNLVTVYIETYSSPFRKLLWLREKLSE